MSTYFSLICVILSNIAFAQNGCLERIFTSDDGICTYCTNSISQVWPLFQYYDDICQSYPWYVYYHPVGEACVTGDDSFYPNNSCCRFQNGSRVLYLGANDQNVGPFDDIPSKCNEPGTYGACNSANTYSGQWCNQYSWCSFMAGTVISSSSSAAENASFTQCTYKVQVDGVHIVATQQYIMPYVAELAWDSTKPPTARPTTEPTPYPTNGAVSHRTGIMMMGCVMALSGLSLLL